MRVLLTMYASRGDVEPMAQHARDDGDVLHAVARQPGRQVVERHVGLLLDLQQLGREVVVFFVGAH